MQKKFANLCRLILADTNTRNLFFFLILNLCFAFVELTYGLWTNSLGLISDSFHMFFDCSALLLGLAASLVTKWKPNEKFTYGFGRAEILAGLANGLFLLFIAFFIMKEAIERTFEPPEVHHERLFIISVLGFIVNLVGIFVFQHGGQVHHHGHGGCSHSHSVSAKPHKHHEHHHETRTPTYDHNSHGYSHFSSPTTSAYDQAVTLDMNQGYTLANRANGQIYPPQQGVHSTTGDSYKSSVYYEPNHNYTQDHYRSHSDHDHHFHDHDHNHLHDAQPFIEPGTSTRTRSTGRGQIMQSVFLHIVADTLGSIGVMISAVLMSQFGWMIADPICSLFIAVLISVSVFPLLKESFYVLMQRVPVEIEDKLPECLTKIQNLKGVISIHETHVWTLNSDIYVGCLKLEVSQGADSRFILGSAKALLSQLGIERSHIQIDQI